MKALFTPNCEKANPYQANPANVLLREAVSFCPSAWISTVLRRRTRPDILYIHWQHPFILSSNWIITLARSTVFIGKLIISKMFGVRIVWTAHNITSHEKEYYSLQIFYYSVLARLRNKTIANSRSSKKEIVKVYRLKHKAHIDCIPHGNFIDNYPNTINAAEAKKRLQLNDIDTLFLFLGAIKEYKSVGDLIEAFDSLALPEAKMLILVSISQKMVDSKEIDTIYNVNGNFK